MAEGMITLAIIILDHSTCLKKKSALITQHIIFHENISMAVTWELAYWEYVHTFIANSSCKETINPAFLPPEKHERVMCRRVMNIMVILRTHFLSTQTALQTLNIDSFSICQLSCLGWLDLRLLPLANVAS